MRVCVFCASSPRVGASYVAHAQRLGQLLAQAGATIVYGGGAVGLMGCLADSALAQGGRVVGILPRFMDAIELGHKGISQMVLVDTMSERKSLMVQGADAVVALPGGCGTLEELMEVFTLKQVGQFVKPLVVLNTDGFYDHLAQFLGCMVAQRFMYPNHLSLWQLVGTPEEVMRAIAGPAGPGCFLPPSG